MLVGSTKTTNTSPFHFKGLEEKPQSSAPVTQENNRHRTFRRAGNACEIIAGACLNSTVIFTFHLLQVHPMGMFLAVGVSHFYFTATAIGEKSFPVVMVGLSASLSCLCALHEPITEYLDARISINAASHEIKRFKSKDSDNFSVVWMVLAIFIFLGIRTIVRSKK